MSDDPTTPCGLAAGRRRRDAALTVLEALRAGLIARGELAMLHVLKRDGQATADDVRAELGELPDADPRWLGAVPRRLRAAGIIALDSHTQSARPAAHARYVAVWRLTDRDAAVRRLAELSAVPPPMTTRAVAGPAAQRLLWEATP